MEYNREYIIMMNIWKTECIAMMSRLPKYYK